MISKTGRGCLAAKEMILFMTSLDAFQEPGFHLTLTFYQHCAPGYANACILEQFIGVLGDLDLSGYALGFSIRLAILTASPQTS
jgi:hypothetical protein